jgi:hypothetical protein
VNPASLLYRFLNEVLPERQLIAEEWGKQAAEAPWPGVAVDGDRKQYRPPLAPAQPVTPTWNRCRFS